VLRAIGNNLLDEPSVGGIVLNFKTLVNANALRKDYAHNAFTIRSQTQTGPYGPTEQAAACKGTRDYVFAVSFLILTFQDCHQR